MWVCLFSIWPQYKPEEKLILKFFDLYKFTISLSILEAKMHSSASDMLRFDEISH